MASTPVGDVMTTRSCSCTHSEHISTSASVLVGHVSALLLDMTSSQRGPHPCRDDTLGVAVDTADAIVGERVRVVGEGRARDVRSAETAYHALTSYVWPSPSRSASKGAEETGIQPPELSET